MSVWRAAADCSFNRGWTRKGADVRRCFNRGARG